MDCSCEQYSALMRHPRLLGEGRSFYHCMSRVVDRQFVLGSEEKEYFRRTMRHLEAFLEVRVVTFCLMSNHFHLLLEVPGRRSDPASLRALDTEELLSKLPLLYDERSVREVREELERAAASGSKRWEREILQRYEIRMGNLSDFVKELKQRFTQWYNRRHRRRGTLWEERFKSVLVEGCEEALLAMAAYIDLNPVRAGLVSDPKDYRWCGYGEACAGGRLARAGLCRILEAAHEAPPEFVGDWRLASARYRMLLFGRGERRKGGEMNRGRNRGFGANTVAWERAQAGRLSLPEVLRCRVRYLCDGLALGSRSYLEGVFRRNRERFGRRRKEGARRMGGADWGELCVMRDLRRRVIDIGPAVMAVCPAR